MPALPWRSQVQAEDAEGGSQKIQSVKCKVVVSLRDGFPIIATKARRSVNPKGKRQNLSAYGG